MERDETDRIVYSQMLRRAHTKRIIMQKITMEKHSDLCEKKN